MRLPQAARRLYTEDGTMILNIDDLVDWARNKYVKTQKQRLQEELNGPKQAGNGLFCKLCLISGHIF